MSKPTSPEHPSAPLVAPLTDFGKNSLALAGGKGANLGELLRAGFDVPTGFVITTAAYDLLLQSESLQPHVRDLVTALGTNDPATMAAGGNAFRSAVEQSPIPGPITEAVLAAYRRLGGPVAVRSSATAEDLPGAAFAGQQETFANVVGETALLEAVRACWASLWSERALLYRIRQEVNQAAAKLAVVVQQMVPAEVAGVMFTANPVSGSRDELTIDASPGLGEAVVSGLVTPDHFVLGRRDRRIREQRLGGREIIIRARADGGTEQITPAPVRTPAPALPTAALRRLVQLGTAIEQHFAAPQDIEWAWMADGTQSGKFLILQARPMTALAKPLKISGPMRMVIPMLAEMWPVRPYPLDMTTFTGTLERSVGNFLGTLLGKDAPDPDKAVLEEDGVVLRFEPPEFHPTPGMLIAPWRTFWRTRHFDPARWQMDPILGEVTSRARELQSRELTGLGWPQIIETIHANLDLIPRTMQIRERYFPRAILGLGGLALLLAVVRRSRHLGMLLSGVETRTTATNRSLEDLAALIRADPWLQELFSKTAAGELPSALARSENGRSFRERFEAFLAEYGHREIALTISQGAWKDRPQIVMELVKVLVGTQPKERDSYQAWIRTRDELLAHSLLGVAPLRPAFLRALTDARCLIQMREDTHFYATLALSPIRRAALELGARLEQAGVLGEPEDVFHLRLAELQLLAEPWPPAEDTAAQIRTLVGRRRARREALAGIPMIDPRFLTVQPALHAHDAVLLTGTPGSPGVAGGPARIIHDSSEFGKLLPGDVLVAPVTNPAWTPLFLHAAAVVVDTGGSASHAAIVAREYGVPAVMGTLKGTQQLTDGQWIQVDGTHGLVLKGEKPE